MHLPAGLVVLAVLHSSWAMPFGPVDSDPVGGDATSIERRLGKNDGSSHGNAIDIRLDATGWEHLANSDAWAMLCADAPRALRRIPGTVKEREKSKNLHYRRSGASALPFKQFNLKKYGLKRPSIRGEAAFESAEEFRFESMDVPDESKRKVYLFPGQRSQQSRQGTRLRQALRDNVPEGRWAHITGFDNCHLTFCEAFNKGDASVCKEKLKANEIDPRKYVAVKTSKPGQKLAFKLVSDSPSKREETTHGLANADSDGETGQEDLPGLIRRFEDAPEAEWSEYMLSLENIPDTENGKGGDEQ